MYTVYILESKEGYRYTGQTSDLTLRLEQHKAGISKWSKRGKEWKVIYKEEFKTRKETRIRENFFKSGVGREYVESKLQEA